MFLTICWPLFEMKAKENCRKPQWESHELVLFNVLHGLYLTERPFVWLKCSHKNTFSRRNIFFRGSKHYWEFLLFQFFIFYRKTHLLLVPFFREICGKCETLRTDLVVEYVLPGFLIVPYWCTEEHPVHNLPEVIFFIKSKTKQVEGIDVLPQSIVQPHRSYLRGYSGLRRW